MLNGAQSPFDQCQRETWNDPREAKKDASFGGRSTAMLEYMQFDPLQWAVPDILPEGLAILAAPPKMGKSYLALGLGVAVASGGKAFGSVECEQGSRAFPHGEGRDRTDAAQTGARHGEGCTSWLTLYP